MWRAAVQKPLHTGFEFCEEEAEGASGVRSRDPALREWGWCWSEPARKQGESPSRGHPWGSDPEVGKTHRTEAGVSVLVWPRKRSSLLKKKKRKGKQSPKSNSLRREYSRREENWNGDWFLQGLLMEWSEVKGAQSCPTLCDCIVHGILQARILEWIAFPFSRGSSKTRDRTQVSRIAGRCLTSWATREAPTDGVGGGGRPVGDAGALCLLSSFCVTTREELGRQVLVSQRSSALLWWETTPHYSQIQVGCAPSHLSP